MNPTCPSCKGSLREAEAVAYHGICEDCYSSRQFSSGYQRFSGAGKRMKGEKGAMVHIEYPSRQSRREP